MIGTEKLSFFLNFPNCWSDDLISPTVKVNFTNWQTFLKSTKKQVNAFKILANYRSHIVYYICRINKGKKNAVYLLWNFANCWQTFLKWTSREKVNASERWPTVNLILFAKRDSLPNWQTFLKKKIEGKKEERC